MSNLSRGPRTKKEARALVAELVANLLEKTEVESMISVRGWSDAQMDRADDAMDDIIGRLRKMTTVSE